jgi:hypothetical protein
MPRARAFIVLLAVVIAAVVVAYGLGSRHAATDTPVAPQTEAAGAPQKPAAAPAARVIDEARFWRLTADTRAAADNDTGRQSELLDARLRRLPAEQIAAFERIRRKLDRRAYTWEVWGAAYVVEDGCSDDCFRDFRAYLISLGRGPYETALRNPDALASTVEDAETGTGRTPTMSRPTPTRASPARTSRATPLTSQATRAVRRGTMITPSSWCSATRGWRRASGDAPVHQRPLRFAIA